MRRVQLGEIEVEPLPNGGRRLHHPSGAVVTEAPQRLAEFRATLVADIRDLQAQLAAFDAELEREQQLRAKATHETADETVR